MEFETKIELCKIWEHKWKWNSHMRPYGEVKNVSQKYGTSVFLFLVSLSLKVGVDSLLHKVGTREFEASESYYRL